MEVGSRVKIVHGSWREREGQVLEVREKKDSGKTVPYFMKGRKSAQKPPEISVLVEIREKRMIKKLWFKAEHLEQLPEQQASDPPSSVTGP